MHNVVLLTVDSLRVDHCSAYGYDRKTTPKLDVLAANGVRFTNAYSPSSHTRESVPALITGQYPHAAVDDGYHLAAPTLATLLDGYHCGAFHSNPFVSRAYGVDRDFDAFDDDLHLGQHKLFALTQRLWDKLRGHHYARAQTINERALDWLDDISEDPFFLWNHYMDVHGPYEPPEPYRSQFLNDDVSENEALTLYDRALEDPDSIDESERRLLRNLYDGEICYTDAQIGAFLDALAERGLLENSVVLVTADHGDGLGDHGQYGHPRHLYEELVRVPFVARGIGDAGRVCEVPVSGLDVVPTLLTAAGESTTELAGKSLQVILADEQRFTDRCVVLEARGEDDDSDRRRYRAVDGTDVVGFERHQLGSAIPDDEGPLSRSLHDHLAAEERADGTRTKAEEAVLADRLDALGYR